MKPFWVFLTASIVRYLPNSHSCLSPLKKKKYLFIYWLYWVFIDARLVSSCGEQRLLFIAVQGFSLQWLLSLQSTGSRYTRFSSCGSWALEHKLNSRGTGGFTALVAQGSSYDPGIFLDQGHNPCLLH